MNTIQKHCSMHELAGRTMHFAKPKKARSGLLRSFAGRFQLAAVGIPQSDCCWPAGCRISAREKPGNTFEQQAKRSLRYMIS